MIGRSDRILVNGYNLSSAMNKIEVKSTREKLDKTSLADGNRIFESGFRTGEASTEGFFDSNTVSADKITDVVSAAFESGAQEVVSLGYGLYALGGAVYMFDGCVANWDLPITVNQIILTNANWSSNNGMMRGKWLASAQYDAGTNNGTSVDNGAATTNGGLFHVHLENDDATDVDVKLQHSTDNSTWVDLTAVNNLSAANDAAAATVAAGTTVRRYLRTVATVTGGNTILVSAAFARG
jgi:hypothetical protein